MSKRMTVKDAQLRLDQLKNGKIPSKEVPTLANPMYAKAYVGTAVHITARRYGILRISTGRKCGSAITASKKAVPAECRRCQTLK